MSNPLMLLLLIAFPVGVSSGQIILKLAAQRIAPGAPIWTLVTEPMLLGAVCLYGSLGLIWFLILKQIPLNTAYPFVALSFVITPILAWQLLGERLGGGYFIGIALICIGVVVTQRAIYAN